MVNGCRACCCLGIPMMLGDDRLGLPILPLLPPPPPRSPPPIPPDCPVGPPTCWLWLSTLRLLMGSIPLQEEVCGLKKKQRHWQSSYNESTQCEGYLLGEGGVCIEPALGVLESWPADWFSPLRLNGGAALLFMPRMGNPNAPTERASRQAWKTRLTLPRFLWANITVMSRHYSAETGQCLSVLLCGPYRLAPSCDSWPVEEAEEDASIWGGQTHNHTDQNTETHTAAADAAACSVTVNHSGKLWRALCCIPGQWGQSEDE